jgi:hypothetical protein
MSLSARPRELPSLQNAPSPQDIPTQAQFHFFLPYNLQEGWCES